jgi:hypothetical protein
MSLSMFSFGLWLGNRGWLGRNNAACALRLARAIADGVGNSCRAPHLHNLEPTIDFDSHLKLPR